MLKILTKRNVTFNIQCKQFSSIYEYKETQIKIRNWNINYLKVGSGSHTVLCLPGILGSIWSDFRPQIEGFDKEKFTLVVMDPLGYGKSRPPNRDFPLNFHEREADYAYELMKAIGIPKYSFLGWSYGGQCGTILAAKYPEAVQKLVLFSTSSHITPHERGAFEMLKDLSLWSPKLVNELIELYGEELLKKYWQDWLDAAEMVVREKDSSFTKEYLKDVKCPTFILHGGKDPLLPPSHLEYISKRIRNSTTHMYPKGKHNIHIAYAEDFNKRVQDFLLQPTNG